MRHRRGPWRTGALVLCGLAAAAAVSAQTSTLALVSTPWPPFTNEPGQPRFALDLVEAALGRIGMTTRTSMVSPAEFTSSLVEGPFDGSAAAWKDAERERVLVFSQPYLENRLVLIGRRGADVSAGSLTDLEGRRLAIVEGYSYGDSVDRGGPVFVRSRSEEDSLMRLLAGEVDYALMDELVVEYIVHNYSKEAADRLQIGSAPLVRRELHLAIRRSRPDAESIVARFNDQLRGMIADGTYHRLLRVEWIRADITGDGIPEIVPRTDRAGPSEPKRVYTLLSTESGNGAAAPSSGFFVGGNIYSDWASVPNRYKVPDPLEPEPGTRSTASLFTFKW